MREWWEAAGIDWPLFGYADYVGELERHRGQIIDSQLAFDASGLHMASPGSWVEIGWHEIERLEVIGANAPERDVTPDTVFLYGWLAARFLGRVKRATLIVHLRSRERAIFTLHRVTAVDARRKLEPVLRASRAGEQADPSPTA